MDNKFMLTNKQRRYLGLEPVEAHWEVMDIKGTLYYFDGNIIKKEIITSDCREENFRYRESELYVETAEDKKLVLPKTAKGKPKKLNFTATQSFRPVNVYFACEGSYITIANYTIQKTFYFEDIKNDVTAPVLENWLKNWIEETAQDDLEDLERFKYEKRVHQKYKEGDIFTFKIGRRQYGFGKILIDVANAGKQKNLSKIRIMAWLI